MDLDDLRWRAETALDGQEPHAVDALLDLAAADLRLGHYSAAVDACYAALSIDPDHVMLHLALVQLYDLQGWPSLAMEKLDLLDRLVSLGEDAEEVAVVAAARAVRP